MLQRLHEAGAIEDSGEFAASINVEHNALVGVLKSLLAYEMITTEVGRHVGLFGAAPRPPSPARSRLFHPAMPQDIDHFRYNLTEEAKGYLGVGSPEAQVFNAVPAEGGIPMAAIKVWLAPKCTAIQCSEGFASCLLPPKALPPA